MTPTVPAPAPAAPTPLRPTAAVPARPVRIIDQPAADPVGAARRILALGRRYRRAKALAAGGRGTLVRATLAAPYHAFRLALAAVREHGHHTRARTGIGLARQLGWAWWVHWRHQYNVRTIYWYRLFSAERVMPVPLWADSMDCRRAERAIVLTVAKSAAEMLADKRRFARWCAEQGLPTAPVLLECEGGAVTRSSLPDGTLPPVDLFAKWATSFGGDDTQRWLWAGGAWTDGDGRRWTSDEIVADLTGRSAEGSVVLQPRLFNHPDFEGLSPNALSTVRVMTTRRPGEAPRFLLAILRMGTGRATADNFAQGGIAAPIDRDTGVTDVARRLLKAERETVEVERHPDTGRPIAGFRVPFWEASIRLALDAHTRAGNLPCVGWDVAVLPDGPVLLEGNWHPCFKLAQVATQIPIYTTEFAPCIAAWLDGPAASVTDASLVENANWWPE